MIPLGLDPVKRPCLIHVYHSPAPWGNDGHHVIPQAWTQHLRIPDSRIVALCPTGHDVVHRAIAAELAGKTHRRLPVPAEGIVTEACDFYQMHLDELRGAPLTEVET